MRETEDERELRTSQATYRGSWDWRNYFAGPAASFANRVVDRRKSDRRNGDRREGNA
jgi:hypothetical protein